MVLDNAHVFLCGKQHVTKLRARFPKPVKHYEPMNIYGKNIVSTEGDDWKKYRKIAAPAFSEVRLSARFAFCVIESQGFSEIINSFGTRLSAPSTILSTIIGKTLSTWTTSRISQHRKSSLPACVPYPYTHTPIC